MLFHLISNFTRFSIDSEPNSLFYKECNRYDGAVNAYKIRDRQNDNMLKPVIFERNYKIKVVKES